MRRYYGIYVILVTVSIWLGTGTLAPYAATHHAMTVDPHCSYALNGDHPHFEATYLFLQGAPAEQWNQSVVLRRILFPIIAYPFMQLSDYTTGGVIASWFLHVMAGLIFLRFVFRRYGEEALLAASLILPTFPGITYFGGLPYSYACIVPFSLLGFMGLQKLYESASPVRSSIIYGLSFGFLSVGYDLLPYLLLAGVALLAYRREWRALICFPVAVLVFPTLNSFVLSSVYQVSFVNSNTASYGNILGAYLKIGSRPFTEWSPLLIDMPRVFLHNVFFSTFFVLPTAIGALLVRAFVKKRSFFSPPEVAFLLAALFIWTLNNAAPPYDGWQLRGTWIARIYEPIFVVMLVYAVRSLQVKTVTFDRLLLGAIFIAQMVIVYAPIMGFSAAADYVYSEFYTHSVHGAYTANLEKYGRRPRGFCARNG